MRLDRLLDALADTRADGCSLTAWSLHATESRRVSLGTKDAETGNPHAPLALSESLTAVCTLVWSDGRVSRGRLERRQIDGDAAGALAALRASSFEDEDGRDVAGPAAFPDVPLHDPLVAATARGEVDVLVPRLEAIRARVAAAGLRTWSGSFHASEGEARVVTSKGLDVAVVATAAAWHVTFDGEWGCGHSARAFDAHEDFEARLDRAVPEVLALRRDAPPRPGGIVPVLLHPDVVEEYVFGALLHNLDGSEVAHGTGAFRREQFGANAPVMREDVALVLDPLVPLAAGASRFTGEGVPARRTDLVRGGRLLTPFADLKYARRLGIPPVPHPAAMDALLLEAGPAIDLPEALARADGGIYVLGVLGVHTQDLSSGEFSLSAPQGLAIEGGRPDGRRRATIAGNLFEILRSPALVLVRVPGEHSPGLLAPCRVHPAGA